MVCAVPAFFENFLQNRIIHRAREKGIFDVHFHSLRDFTHDTHRTIDDYPYGGGAGMVLKPEPFFEAMDYILQNCWGGQKGRIILLSPQGKVFSEKKAWELSQLSHFALLCGRYEGVDERVAEALADEELSIGDYILMSGEAAALVVLEAVARLYPGVLEEESIKEESFQEGILDYPKFTRPAVYRGLAVPEILLSGDHKKIARWRKKEALRKTLKNRPDLLKGIKLSEELQCLMKEIEEGNGYGGELA